MTHTKKILISLLVLAACGNVLQAQEVTPRHEVSASLQGGIASMPFHGSVSWKDTPGFSLGFGVNYTYWFSEKYGFRTGLRLNRMSHNQKTENLDLPFDAMLPLSSIGIVGGSGLTTVSLRGFASTVEEHRQYTFIELPLQLAMRFDRVHLAFGISLAKAFSAEGDYNYRDLGYSVTALPDLGVTLPAPVDVPLVGESEGIVNNADMVKPFFWMLAIDAEYKFYTSNFMGLGLGLYGRYAPVAYNVNDPAQVFDIQSDASYRVVLPSTTTLVDRVSYYEVGVSLNVSFGHYSSKKGEETVDETVLVESADVVESVDAGQAEAEQRIREEEEAAAAKALLEKAEADRKAAQQAREQAEIDRKAAQEALERAEREKQKEEQEQPVTPEAVRAEAQKKLDAINATVYFAFSGTKAQFDEKTDDAIKAICAAMQADPTLKVTIYGHTDKVGSAKVNRKYGLKRARALKRYMVKLGAPSQNIQCVSKGESDPVADNNTREGRKLNRRATVELK